MTDSYTVYSGPQRTYPRKTFAGGADAPNVVKEELLQIPDYIDYSVFTKNQLRIAELIFNGNTYKTKENYIRSQNFFINLNRPRYWNYTNVVLLFNNITIVLDIVDEIFTNLKTAMAQSKSGVAVSTEITSILNNLKGTFSTSSIPKKNLIQYLLNLGDKTKVLPNIFGSTASKYSFKSFAALNTILAAYAKVVSILTYVNPYVLVKKDSGVNSMTPPSTVHNLKFPAGTKVQSNTPLSKFLEADVEHSYEPEVSLSSPEGRTINGRISKSDKVEGKITKKIQNPIVRLLHFPCYSLNILLPLTISPITFINVILTETEENDQQKIDKQAMEIDASLAKFNNLRTQLAELKVIGSYLKIGINSLLSKIYIIDEDNLRYRLNIILKKDANKKEKALVKLTEGTYVNVDYYRKLVAFDSRRCILEGTLGEDGTVSFDYLTAIKLTDENDLAALKEAKTLMITVNNPDAEEQFYPNFQYPDNSTRTVLTAKGGSELQATNNQLQATNNQLQTENQTLNNNVTYLNSQIQQLQQQLQNYRNGGNSQSVPNSPYNQGQYYTS